MSFNSLLRRLAGAPSAMPVADQLPGFDEAVYLDGYPDVRAAVAAGIFPSGAAHYRAFGRAEGRDPRPKGVRVVRGLAELDVEIANLRELERRSFSEWLRARARFCYHEDLAALPPDPTSSAYRACQLALYNELAGTDEYNSWKAEPTPINLAQSIDPHPFPFSSRDGELIGGHLISLGYIMRALWRAAPGGGRSVLEYGCGTGFTTVLLAASGYRVTAVDINADALKVIDAIAATRGLRITTFNGEFGQVPDPATRFELILFYEAFHHCLDFIALLRMLHDRLTPAGAVIFAGEPVTADFPKPWGLRLDGASLWEIRTKRWLELGFHEEFFLRILRETGWRAEKIACPGAPDIFVAHQS
jgi:SAM-dependent methyltransferase